MFEKPPKPGTEKNVPHTGKDESELILISDDEVAEFLEREGDILRSIGLPSDLPIERMDLGGSIMGFAPTENKIVYDPNAPFFKERGFNMKDTLFATSHELIAHYAEMVKDPELYLSEFERTHEPDKDHLGFLHNIFEDVKGNKSVVTALPFLEETKNKLYTEKLFPGTDYRGKPDHIQFGEAFLREAMVPDETVQISSEARRALDSLKEFGDKKINVLDIVTSAQVSPKDRFTVMKNIVEPIFEQLRKEDIKKGKEGKQDQGDKNPKNSKGEESDQKQSKDSKDGSSGKQDKKEGKDEKPDQSGKDSKNSKDEEGQKQDKKDGKDGKPGQSGESSGNEGVGEGKQDKKEQKQSGEGGDGKKTDEEIAEEFKKYYQDYENKQPRFLDPKEEKEMIEAVKKAAKERKEAEQRKMNIPNPEEEYLKKWAKEHGLDVKDVLGYRKEYQEVAPYVAQLREVFKKIVARRAKQRWRQSRTLHTEGEELAEDALVSSYLESKAGGEPKAFRDIERRERPEKNYGALDMTLVNDTSGSMQDDGKIDMDRKCKLLFMEALQDFSNEIKKAEKDNSDSLDLTVRSEVRNFGNGKDTEVKPLGDILTEKERIDIWKKLHHAEGGTPDYKSLEAILKNLTPEDERSIKEGIRRKVVVVLSDGGGDDVRGESGKLLYDEYRISLIQKGVILVELGMLTTERPHAEVVTDLRDLPGKVKSIILRYTEEICNAHGL